MTEKLSTRIIASHLTHFKTSNEINTTLKCRTKNCDSILLTLKCTAKNSDTILRKSYMIYHGFLYHYFVILSLYYAGDIYLN